MSFLRSPMFFGLYQWMPHRFLNLLVRWAMQLKRPRWFVRFVIERWIALRGIDMSHFVDVPIEEYENVEAFFLRELKPGARPLGEGFVSPVDGLFVAFGAIERDTLLQAKGQLISVPKMINGEIYQHPLHTPEYTYEGGTYLTIFLTPNGYHRLHAPCDMTVQTIQWLPGRFFPQNEDAIHHVPRIYERNERAVLLCERREGEKVTPFVMVLVGASLIGGIHLKHLPREQWCRFEPTHCALSLEKGQEFAHFSFGSTLVMLFPEGWEQSVDGAMHPAQLHADRQLEEALLLGVPLIAGVE